jgi:uncharacterized protein
MSHAEIPERFAPEVPFPPYAFVPGRHPHPVTHPEGHRFGQVQEPVPAPDSETLESNPHFRFGLDLFNHGYYWEAHEVWEELWHAAGRQGALADFLKALIKLAAAGVKAREGNQNGVIKHARRAAELFTQTGYSQFANSAEELLANPIVDSTFTLEGNPILPIRLGLEDVVRE